MNEIEWDIQEVKHLKKKQLVQSNIVMLLLFVLSVYYVIAGWPISIFLGVISLLLWFFAAHALYILITGKTTGSKTNKLVQAFDRDHWGEKRWKRKKVTEAIILSSISVMWTIFVYTVDVSSETLQFFNLWPFMAACI